jgi:ankyrin repeat protein
MVPNASSLRCQARQCQSKDDIDVIKKLLGAKAIQTLFDAAKAADLQAVKTLLEEGADVDATDSDGDTALHMAAAGGDADIVLALLDARANANIKDSRGDSPLHVASFYGHAYVVQILINRGAVLEERNNAGFTALHYASLNGHMEAVKTLLDAGADVNAQNFQTGATAILIATIGNLIDVVRLLIANGGDPTIPTDFGVSALHEAAAVKGSNALMELLINEGLDVDTLNYDGVTVLEFATYYGNADAVRFLLSKGASPYLGAGDGLFDKVCGCTDEVDRKARKCAAGGCQGDEDTAEIEELLRDARAAKPLPPTPPTSAPWSTPSPKPPAPYEGSLDCDNLLTLVARLECAVARASDLP